MKKVDEQIKLVNSSREFVVIDLETSHFSPEKGGMIIEVAGVKIRDGKIVDSMSSLIDPERKLTRQITEITAITNEMVEGQRKFREVLPEFYAFIGNATVIAHNAKFDWDRYMMFFLRKIGIVPLNEVIDTVSLSRMYLKNSDKKYNLGYLCEMVNINIDGAHRALADAMATAELFLHIKENFIPQDSQVQIDLTEPEVKTAAPKSQNVRRVSYWEKTVSGGKTFRRLYVTLDRSAVFYDIPSRRWEVKASDEPIDFNKVQSEVLDWYKAKDFDSLIAVIMERGA